MTEIDRPSRADDGREADASATPGPEHDPEQSEAGSRNGSRDNRDVIDLSRPDADDKGSAESGRQDAGERDVEREPPDPPGKGVFVIAGLILVAALGWGAYAHWRDYDASRQTASVTTDRVVDVRTAEAKRQDQPIMLTLPGQTDAFDTASIYPRATGYIGERLVDIGSRVKKGDLLVHIVAPDLDEQLAQAEAQIGQTRAAKGQAEAQLAQAQANVHLAQVTFDRTNQLTGQGYETLQNRDNQQANVESQQANVESARAGIGVADANIKAQQATIDRLKALADFEDVRAPFDGVITSRTVDIGDLLNADTSTSTSTAMFTMARDNVIRVTVRVPQSDAVGVTNGIEATVSVPQLPGRIFKSTVTRSSEALLYSSRTLTTEVDVPNPDGALRSGLYVSVTLTIPRSQPAVTVPAEALMFNQHGMQVATAENGVARLHQVSIERDLGTTVDLKEGLRGGERIILEPPVTLADGEKIKEHPKEEDNKPGDQKAKPGVADQKQADANSTDPSRN